LEKDCSSDDKYFDPDTDNTIPDKDIEEEEKRWNMILARMAMPMYR